MTWHRSMLQVPRGGAESHQENSLTHIGVRTIQSILHRFFRFEISVKPSYPLSKNVSLDARAGRRF
jgi:hypothetical protein